MADVWGERLPCAGHPAFGVAGVGRLVEGFGGGEPVGGDGHFVEDGGAAPEADGAGALVGFVVGEERVGIRGGVVKAAEAAV